MEKKYAGSKELSMEEMDKVHGGTEPENPENGEENTGDDSDGVNIADFVPGKRGPH